MQVFRIGGYGLKDPVEIVNCLELFFTVDDMPQAIKKIVEKDVFAAKNEMLGEWSDKKPVIESYQFMVDIIQGVPLEYQIWTTFRDAVDVSLKGDAFTDINLNEQDNEAMKAMLKNFIYHRFFG